MLRKVESTSDVNRGSEPCQSGTALIFLVQLSLLCLAYTRVVDGAERAYAHAHAHAHARDGHHLNYAFKI